MNTRLTVVLIALSGLFVGACNGQVSERGSEGLEHSLGEVESSDGQLSDEEARALSYIREEEKMARDVYLALGDRWGHRTFENISAAEQRHMDATLMLLDTYGVDDPVGDNGRGVFVDPGLLELHDQLVRRGNRSLLDAFMVGAEIEEIDIADIEERRSQTRNADLLRVYDNLLRGSRNHLRAYVRNIEREGGVYEPKVLDGAQFAAIVDGDHERGNGRRNGRGNGRGWRGGR